MTSGQRQWAWAALSACCAVAALLYVHHEGVVSGRDGAQVATFERATADALTLRHRALDTVARAQAKVPKVDSAAVVAKAHQLVAAAHVRIVAPDSVRITPDSGAALVVAVPRDVVTLVRVDSALISAQAAEIAARDTVIAAQTAALAADALVIADQDSVVKALKAQPKGRGTVVVVTAIATSLLLGGLHFLLR